MWMFMAGVFFTLAGVFHLDTEQVGCSELRSKRYISDGFCTSVKPITEVVCSGHCLPLRTLPWYAQIQKVWAKYKAKEWRCVEDKVTRKRVHLLCDNSERRSYKIKVVRSCKCKRYNKRHNMSRLPRSKRSRSSKRKKDQKQKAIES